jgi:hypothetical protein
MVGSTNSKLAPAIGDPDRDSLALFSCFPTFSFQLSIEDPDPVGTVNLFLFNVPTFEPSNVPTFFDLSSVLSIPCALFCATQILNPFLFNRFRTLCQKPPGVGGHTRARSALRAVAVSYLLMSSFASRRFSNGWRNGFVASGAALIAIVISLAAVGKSPAFDETRASARWLIQ